MIGAASRRLSMGISMFANQPIGRKIATCFSVIVLAVLAMMAVLYNANASIADAAARSVRSENIHRLTLEMEIAILRQNSQVRGFLITGDEGYLKQFREARDNGSAAAKTLASLLTLPQDRARVAQSDARIRAWRVRWGDPLIAQVRAGDRSGAQAKLSASSKTVTMVPVLAPLRDLRADARQVMSDTRAAQDAALRTSLIALAAGGVALLGLAISLSMLLARQLARPVVRLTTAMATLAAGDNGVVVPDTDRGDELGRMSQAMLVFRDAAIAKAKSDMDQHAAVSGIGAALSRLADADLTTRLSGFPDGYGTIERDFNAAVQNLSAALLAVSDRSAGIDVSANEIARASDDLAARTERQAASLEETAAAMDEITSTVRDAADGAARSSNIVNATRSEAEAVGTIVRQAVNAMGGIERTSSEIGEIIALIDGIAFQTNLLALNAGVEAARAGDAGRGFAVVASEVRALAQRSADAANDVKSRIVASRTQVELGVSLVAQTGKALGSIIGRIEEVSVLAGQIATSSAHQASGMGQVNIAVNEMESVTQQNAAMVEQSNAAARTLSSDAAELMRQVRRFRIQSDTPATAATPLQRTPVDARYAA
ncbi:CHASE3 domain-containing protein [Microvirga sp. SRT01]|uniref:CHASE3 domain-containing protein n=1 Tax=Sphingomonas longa TaxID=2778730 RepID=A0ABS2D937_9SPHN|nr:MULTISPECIES: methyl-accepting chemotaxis protein [Alphaproteobacteria]MBM6577452.1 CHASE3 domain-containing protein [Sphingomonas sp. BT552]MBR7710497.1 CHASE3 domain-containing protein [Microvirga sp. SRT01]